MAIDRKKFLMPTLRHAICVSALLGLTGSWIGCGSDQLAGPEEGPILAPGIPKPAELGDGFSLGPIRGITTGWHPMPSGVVLIPAVGAIEVRFGHAPGEYVDWRGATEKRRTRSASYAVCPVESPGEVSITAIVRKADSEGVLQSRQTCHFRVVDADLSAVQVRKASVTRPGLQLDESASNDQTMEHFFGKSIATLRKIGANHYRTSSGTELDLTSEINDERFASVIEWRINGVPVFLGADVSNASLRSVGSHRISVGPPSKRFSMRLDTYSVQIVSHVSGEGTIPNGRPVTFRAATDPPGYEDEITWLSSTKFGSAHPVVGAGPTFTVVFNGTWDRGFQWLGVKADNVKYNKDAKSTVTFGITEVPGEDSIAFIASQAAPNLIRVKFDPISEVEMDSLIEVFGYLGDELAQLPQSETIPMINVLQSDDGAVAASLWETGFPGFRGTAGQQGILRRLSNHINFFRHKSVQNAGNDWVANGCTLAPDFNFTDCCNAHDQCYCNQSGRSACDQALKDCITAAGHPYLACVYWAGVRAFGWLFYKRADTDASFATIPSWNVRTAPSEISEASSRKMILVR